ncbi:hypothetical protein T484DRAFT_1797413 [Baffinella frigidus]|nr:hypothetical protein T484DRAFT_1797413 [Cryptophyta sp. CCMP2293]
MEPIRVVLRAYKPSVPLSFLQHTLGFKVRDALDDMLNKTCSDDSDDDDDDGEGWAEFATSSCIQSVSGDLESVDVKATLEALAAQ